MIMQTIRLEEALNRNDTGGDVAVGWFVVMHKDMWLIQCAAETYDQAKSDLDQFCEEMDMPAVAFEIMQVVE